MYIIPKSKPKARAVALRIRVTYRGYVPIFIRRFLLRLLVRRLDIERVGHAAR